MESSSSTTRFHGSHNPISPEYRPPNSNPAELEDEDWRKRNEGESNADQRDDGEEADWYEDDDRDYSL
jgi:hypothetical protein